MVTKEGVVPLLFLLFNGFTGVPAVEIVDNYLGNQ
jgi:hypothetical protein